MENGSAAAAMNMHSANATSEEKTLDLEIPRNVTNELDYQTAQGLVSRAQYVLNNDLKPLVTSNLTDTINDVNRGHTYLLLPQRGHKDDINMPEPVGFTFPLQA